MKDKILIAISILLLGVWSCILMKDVLGEYRTPDGWEAMLPAGTIRFYSGGAGKLDNGGLGWNGEILSVEYRNMLSLRSAGDGYKGTSLLTQPLSQSGVVGVKVYSTASVSPHWYGGGPSGFKGDGAQNSGNGNKETPNASGVYSVRGAYALNPRTFTAMATKVRNTAEEFEYGDNAIGADSPDRVIKRTPGSGPVTDDPEHQPTVVTPTPIGNGLYVLLILAMCYCMSCLRKRNKEEI